MAKKKTKKSPDMRKTRIKSSSPEFLPRKLENDTILDAIFEIRFEPSAFPAAEVLAGILFQKFSTTYPKLEKLPLAHIPFQAYENDPDMRYKSSLKLFGDTGSIMVGSRVLTLIRTRPYCGWAVFKKTILGVLGELKKTNLVNKVERIAVRYTNILPFEQKGLGNKVIAFNGNLGKYDLSKQYCNIRTEIVENNCLNIIQLQSDVVVSRDDGREKINGIMLDIDTIYERNLDDFWSKKSKYVDMLHSVEKSLYFGVLNKETLESYGPRW